ncbi:hypothetical protein [Sphaerotilus sp.]|uniref:hypothetical protein n=1 Tax=Sphaerotilus sp. TaxID=2093942 RepID=UPI0034E2E39A
MNLDVLISVTIEQNSSTRESTHDTDHSDQQKMAIQVSSQAISISLSIRELIRQGYLFGAHVLLRPLVERSMILLYIYEYPADIKHWNNGWEQGKAPGLPKMIDRIAAKGTGTPEIKGSEMLRSMNSLMHSKPDSAYYNLVPAGEDRVGFASSKILNRPELCDSLCADVIPQLAIVGAMLNHYFPKVSLPSVP